MTLQSNTIARVSEELLIQLTNQGQQGKSINTARLDLAATDVEAMFPQETGLTYDDSDPAHVQVGVLGMLWTLTTWTHGSGPIVDKAEERWNRAAIRLAQTRGGERRILPQTNSQAKPERQVTDRRADFDRDRYDGYVPNAPGATDGEFDRLE